jgi:Domain of unknown function (DUF5062)
MQGSILARHERGGFHLTALGCPAHGAVAMKPKDEAALFKAGLRAGIRYAEGRGAVQFEATDSASDKALYVYRLLVHDKVIAPMPEDQVAERTIRHRLASWYAHLPEGHPLLEGS